MPLLSLLLLYQLSLLFEVSTIRVDAHLSRLRLDLKGILCELSRPDFTKLNQLAYDAHIELKIFIYSNSLRGLLDLP